jgi:hypothetical protein
MDHPLLNLEIRRLFGDFFSHVSTSPTANQLGQLFTRLQLFRMRNKAAAHGS